MINLKYYIREIEYYVNLFRDMLNISLRQLTIKLCSTLFFTAYRILLFTLELLSFVRRDSNRMSAVQAASCVSSHYPSREKRAIISYNCNIA